MKIRFCILLVCSSIFSSGQRSDYTSKNPKAIRLFEVALQFYDTRRDVKALEQITEVLNMDSTFVEAYLLRANIHQDRKETDKAIEAYKQSLHFLPDFFPNTYCTLGDLYFSRGNYAEARPQFEKYLSYNTKNKSLNFKAQKGLQSCIFADSAMKHPVPFAPENMGDSINSTSEEYFPAITADGKTFLFTRRIVKVNDYGKKIEQEDFYMSRFGNDWSMSVPVSEINTSGNEGAPSLSADGRYLFFTACQEFGGYPGGKQGKGACDIFLSRKDGNKWGEARNLEGPVNSGEWESQPSFSSDGRTLYFIRRVKDKDGHTNSDILMSSIGDDSKWSAPVTVSDKINTTGMEMSVFIHPDDQTLYFSSDGRPGMGGLDIYVSRREADGSWGEPLNLGYPINTHDDENSLLVSPSGKIAYFASNRKGGVGGLDIYEFELYPGARPRPITYMKGKVMDANSKAPLSGNFELIDLASGKTVVRSTSDPITGEFLVTLPAGKSYALNVSRKDYLFYSENFQLKDATSAGKPFLKDVLMHPMKTGEKMVLKNIFFATDSFRLKPESKIELEKLVAFMNANPGLKLEVSGHTDNVGDKKYNQVLSEKRSKSVYEYLVGAGIPADRLTSKGYGDTKPLASNATEEGKSQNRRTEFLVTSTN